MVLSLTIKVLNPNSAWGGGHVQTCINLVRGMSRAGANIRLYLLRARTDMTDVPHRATVPWPISRFGWPTRENTRKQATERRFLRELQDGEIAWLWPTVTLSTYRAIAKRGNPIVMEGINTRMGSARQILDRVYAAEGMEPRHGISSERIAEEEEMLGMADGFFAPAPGVEAALAEPGSAFRGRMLPSSYGAYPVPDVRLDHGAADGIQRVLFVGTLCLRKNVHGLLRAWARLAPEGARLVLCGRMTPEVRELCSHELSLPSVELRGHVLDIGAAYQAADTFIMPSFEEGGPQVTYEAAMHGLPILASSMGAGRLVEAVYPIDPWDVDGMAHAIGCFLNKPPLRRSWAERTFTQASSYSWDKIGQKRLSLLEDWLE